MSELPVRRISKKEVHLARVMYWVWKDVSIKPEAVELQRYQREYGRAQGLIERFGPALGIELDPRVLIRKHTFLFAHEDNPLFLRDAVPHERQFVWRDRGEVMVTYSMRVKQSWADLHLVLVKHPQRLITMPDEADAFLNPSFEKTDDGKVRIKLRPHIPYTHPVQPPKPKRLAMLRTPSKR